MINLYHDDCLNILETLNPNTIDTCITDPPYGLKFMGKDWDHGVPGVKYWKATHRVLKPGAILLAFGGTRTHHRLMVNIEDSGFEIRDMIMWLYGSGFPKSHDISKAIDKPEAATWDGWGTTLKPAWEPIIVAMKPRDGTFANNALTWGVAGLWIDGSRIPLNGDEDLDAVQRQQASNPIRFGGIAKPGDVIPMYKSQGRWPANLILDEAAGAMLDGQSGESKAGVAVRHRSGDNTFGGDNPKPPMADMTYSDTGGASRFFYCTKSSKSERWFYCKICEDVFHSSQANQHIHNRSKQNHIVYHPTQKPEKLMEYLAKLTKTPTGGIVIDPFMGTGSTGKACINIDRDFIGIDYDFYSFKIAEKRLKSND